MDPNNCRDFFFHIHFLFVASILCKNLSCVSMLLHASRLIFLVVCRGGTMKSEEFLLSQTLPSCSNHPSSPDQPRAGNPGRSVVLSTDTQPPSSFSTSSPLFTYLSPLFSLGFASFLWNILSVFGHIRRENAFCPFLSSQFLLLSLSIVKFNQFSYHHILSFSSSVTAFPVCPDPFPLNKIQFHWHAPLQAAVSVCTLFLPLCFFLSPTSHLCYSL